MRGKQRLCPQKLWIADMLHYRPGNAQAVKGAGSPADFIQNQQAVPRGISQDIRHLCHLHHKGTLAGSQVIRCADTGENPVYDANFRTVRRHEAAELRHQHDQGGLAHIGGFSSHIGSGNDRYPMVSIVQIRVIGNEHIVAYHLFHDRMPPAFDVDDPFFIDLRTHILIALRYCGKRREHIRFRNRLCRFLDARHLFCDGVTDVTEHLIFQSEQFIFCSQNEIFQLFEFGGDIPLGICQGLFPHIAFRHQVFKRIGYFQIVAKDLIVFDFQIFDSGRFPLFCFQLCQPGFSFGL